MEQIYYNALNLASEANLSFLAKTSEVFDSFEQAWFAPKEKLKNCFQEKSLEDFLARRQKINPKKEFAKLKEQGIELILFDDPVYPALLREISHAPLGLYIKTKADFKRLFADFTIGIVGTRRASQYGKEAARKLSFELAKFGAVIVSGLAWGIDAVCHQAALDAKGSTLAVLGSGLNLVHPPRNRKLAQEIVDSDRGILISEYPLDTPALPHHFPQRNRIVSGLSRGLLVVEAPKKSGALITASFALEQNRELFVVPGSIFSKNIEGCNLLIQSGAKLVTKAEEVLAEFSEQLGLEFSETGKEVKIFDSSQEEKIFHVLEDAAQSLDVDKIIERVKLPPKDIISNLSLLEMKGYVKNIGGRYSINH